MHAAVERYFELLRTELQQLKGSGGLAAASVYDTAQVLRYAPSASARRVVGWLLQEQRADGGWGKLGVSPLARSVPTLAAVLALHEKGDSPEAQQAVGRGLEFLRQNAQNWAAAVPLPDDIPVAVELILPMLLDEAASAGMQLPQEPFQALRALGQKRLGLIARFKPGPGSTASHAWETWGGEPTLDWLDPLSSVGHSPSATAYWMHKRKASHPEDEKSFRAIRAYLDSCSVSTSTGIPGVSPTCWPIDRWEQLWALLSLFETGLLRDSRLQDIVIPHLDDVQKALKPEGIGLSDHFICDGDDTAAALCVLVGTGRQVDVGMLERFLREGQFITYPQELQPSLTTTTHGMLALALLGRDVSASVRLVEQHQRSDGRWLVDKWNCSWLYATSQSMIALGTSRADSPALARGMEALIGFQREDGSWGATEMSTCTETAFGVRALFHLRHLPIFHEGARRALQRAARWMAAHVDAPAHERGETYWIDKEPFATPRLDRVYELSSLIALALAGFLDD
jgi:hypothetical protein